MTSILLTGGSACGKSTFAEHLATQLPQPRLYIATMRVTDDELRLKVARHQTMRREKGFESIERDVDIAGIALPPAANVLLECLCNLVANELFDTEGIADSGAYQRVLSGIVSLEERTENLIVVTNDVGSATAASYNEGTRLYMETLGRLNAEIASRFDIVYELVCGIPLLLKGKDLLEADRYVPAPSTLTLYATARPESSRP